jgi:hypothetical protein
MHAMKAYWASKVGGWGPLCRGEAPGNHGIAASQNNSHLLTDIENTQNS